VWLSDFAQGSLSALVGAALGYWVGFLQKYREDRKRRQNVATALLAELRPLERMLRTRAEHAKAAESTVQIQMPVFDQFASDVLLFKSPATHALLELRGFIRDIENTAELFVGERGTADERANHYMRLKAIAAANLIPRVTKLLEAAGGVFPPDPEVGWYPTGKLPQLVDPAFPNASNLRR
jgi:hypothetical protein